MQYVQPTINLMQSGQSNVPDKLLDRLTHIHMTV